MTATFRKKLRNGVLLAILGIGLFAIVITGFGTGGMGGMGGTTGRQAVTIAEIGGNDVTDAEVSRQLELAYRQYQQQNPSLDTGAFYREAFDPLLDQLLEGRTLVAMAQQLGMVVPETLVDREIVSDRRFQNVAGQYEDIAFRRFLEDVRMSEREVRDEIRNLLLARMVSAPVAGRGRMPASVVRAYADLLLEARTGQLGAVPTAFLARSIQPSDQEVAQFYQANQQLFQLPERRVIRFALVGREQLGDAARVTDQEIAAFYQENQARFGPTETRSLRIFTTQDEAVARRVAERVRGGTSFVEAAGAEGFSAEDVTFPNLNREQVEQQTSEEVANAVFGAAQNGLVGPTRTPSGFKVVRVESITRNEGRSLESLRGEISAALQQRKVTEALGTRSDELTDQLEDGRSLEEVAREAGLQIQTTPAVSTTGSAPGFQLPAEFVPVVRAAFDVEENEPFVTDVQPDAQIALVEVTSVVAPAAPPLDQIRDQVRQRLIERTATERARTIADAIARKINEGMAPAQAYSEAGLPLPPPETRTERRSQIERAGEQAPPPFRILFAIPEGRARVVAAPDNAGWIIVHHVRRTPGNAANDPEGRAALAEMERRLSSSGAAELTTQFARAIRSVVEVERDQGQIDALRQRLITGQ